MGKKDYNILSSEKQTHKGGNLGPALTNCSKGG